MKTESTSKIETHVNGVGERAVLISRFFLIPMYVGLMVCMLMYNITFFKELWEMCHSFIEMQENLKELLLLGVLSLLDMVMIANLIVMITIGSYSIFIKEIDSANVTFAPRFLRGLTSGILKVKMGTSLVSVSSIHLLTDFMNAKHTSWDDLTKKMIIHIAFIISAFAFAKMEAIIHPPTQNTENH
jgi:uncharacterized protein (TIGR00645 family)